MTKRKATIVRVRAEDSPASYQAVLERLTTREATDFNVLVDGEDLHLCVLMEDKQGNFQSTYTILPTARFMDGSLETSGILEHLGCVTVLLPTDAEQRGAMHVLRWIKQVARKEGFNVIAWELQVTTAEVAANMERIAKGEGLSFPVRVGSTVVWPGKPN